MVDGHQVVARGRGWRAGQRAGRDGLRDLFQVDAAAGVGPAPGGVGGEGAAAERLAERLAAAGIGLDEELRGGTPGRGAPTPRARNRRCWPWGSTAGRPRAPMPVPRPRSC